jgi:hypothetical protein
MKAASSPSSSATTRKIAYRNFAATIGVLIVAAIFALAIGLALLVENGRNGRKVWPFYYLGSVSQQELHLHIQNGYGKI